MPEQDDLPDIVEIVHAMGRDAGEESNARLTAARDPSPALSEPNNVDRQRLPGHLEHLADRARDYVEAASSANTRRAYASDWKHFSSWCRRQGFALLPPDPQTVGLYITALASGSATGTASGDKKSVSTIERRLSALTWNYAQRGQPLDRKDRAITKIFHFGRFDLAVLAHAFGTMPQPVFCTKIASKLTRTYTDRHGLKELCSELLEISISKQQQSSDWGAEMLTQAQLEYAASDVLYLHRLRAVLEKRLQRDGRTKQAEACFRFLPTRAELDLMGWAEEDIFAHS